MNSILARQQKPEAQSVKKVRVMVVDDSVVIRGIVSRWLNQEPDIEVVASHRHGLLAVNDIGKSRPDVVVLDIEMPEMDGMEALPLLLKNCPGVKIVMASTLTSRNATISMKALQLGASDYIPKPNNNSGVTTSTEFHSELVAKVKALGGIDVTGRRVNKVEQPANSGAKAPMRLRPGIGDDDKIVTKPFSRIKPKILAVGSSTGGPPALFQFFKELSPALNNIPVVITQHMPATFTAILAEHISRVSNRQCREAVDGEKLEPGVIYVAPGGKHLIVKGKERPVISLSDGPRVNFCKPAADPMFESVAETYGGHALGVVFTGMGNDGASGSVTMSKAGGSIIAQDKKSSVVWGMPGATAHTGICSAVLPLNEMAAKVTKILSGRLV
jgi:two-component system, chemotaxis family, protein-glutamate methylesterase/glutaminase